MEQDKFKIHIREAEMTQKLRLRLFFIRILPSYPHKTSVFPYSSAFQL